MAGDVRMKDAQAESGRVRSGSTREGAAAETAPAAPSPAAPAARQGTPAPAAPAAPSCSGAARARLLDAIERAMIEFDAGDAKRIQHFIKVHDLARLIGRGEGLRGEALFTLEAAAYVHDIGIHPAEAAYGYQNGKLQGQMGPAPARELLERVGVAPQVVDRVCYLVAHHHTYTDIDGVDYQALVEADFMVNLFEDGASAHAIETAYEKIFSTQTGSALCRTMFGLAG